MGKIAQFSKSRKPNLVRHRGGKYYVAAKVGGKLIRRSLKTDDFNTALLRLPKALEEIRGAKNASEAGILGQAIHDDALSQKTAALNYGARMGSERLTGALLDRVTHRVHIIEPNGESYRLKDARKRHKKPPRG